MNKLLKKINVKITKMNLENYKRISIKHYINTDQSINIHIPINQTFRHIKIH